MKEISNTLSADTIENMYLAELHYQGISITNDPRLRYDIVHESVRLLLAQYGSDITTDPSYCLDQIRAQIYDIDANYPEYFMTGEEL